MASPSCPPNSSRILSKCRTTKPLIWCKRAMTRPRHLCHLSSTDPDLCLTTGKSNGTRGREGEKKRMLAPPPLAWNHLCSSLVLSMKYRRMECGSPLDRIAASLPEVTQCQVCQSPFDEKTMCLVRTSSEFNQIPTIRERRRSERNQAPRSEINQALQESQKYRLSSGENTVL